jgi:ferrous iron transport protein B
MAYAKKLVRFLTFVPCSGKLPVLAFLCGLVFGVSAFGVLYFYIVSVFLGILLCGFAVRRPKLKSMSFLAFVRIVIANIFDFFKRVSIGICTAVTVLFTLQYFGLLVPIAKIFTPILAPIGLAFPFAVIALAFGIAGKEMVIGAVMTFSAAFAEMSTLSSVSFILFVLLYPPCFAALVAIRDKFGARFALSTIAFNLFVAYVVSFIVYNVATVILMC